MPRDEVMKPPRPYNPHKFGPHSAQIPSFEGGFMRPICALVLVSAAIASVSPYSQAEPQARIQAVGEAAEPFRVIGNIYYVGGQYGAYLITTPEGHILHDTGSAEMHPLIVSNIEKLGFNVRDIGIMISSHAHWDHVEGHAAMKRVTGAQVVALGGDAVALESGQDNSAIGARNFEPVPVDRVIEDGDTVVLGGESRGACAGPRRCREALASTRSWTVTATGCTGLVACHRLSPAPPRADPSSRRPRTDFAAIVRV